MKMKYLLLIPALCMFIGCSNPQLEKEVEALKKELSEAEAAIVELNSQTTQEGELVHMVFLKVKPDTDQAALMDEMKKLAEIEGVQDFAVGPFENLGDARALSEYALVMEMSFADSAAYGVYQKHPTHLNLRENLGQYLAGPPATFDYIKK